MNIQQFLDHHGIASNPFVEEDAQTDPVFKEHCIASMHHPTWDKICGDPREPSTSVVFGEKGAGKTALRLQIAREVARFNQSNPNQRLFVIEYDDFNPFLDRFRDTLSRRKRRVDRVLGEWKLWDHMDAILAIGVTQLVDALVSPTKSSDGKSPAVDETTGAASVGKLEPQLLSRHQARDLLLLAACYDRSTAETPVARWHRLRKVLRFRVWKTRWPVALGIVVPLAVVGLVVGLQEWAWLKQPWPYLAMAAAWLPYLWKTFRSWVRARRVARNLKVLNRPIGPLTKIMAAFSGDELAGQPLPTHERTDDRFTLFEKFQGLLATLGFPGILVLVDRVDEPHLINGQPEQMRALLWPMLDNKFLKQPGLGFKLLLPIELAYFIDREDRDFYQRSRLDKQNMVRSLEWTGEALYDVANARLRACAAPDQKPSLKALFDPKVGERRLIDALQSLRVPRHLFKFLYRVFVAHCNRYTDENPVWEIGSETFESELALYQRDQDAFDRGLGAG